MNLFCIAKFGYMAAAYTTLVAYIVLALGEAVCAHVVCKKERGANYEVYNDKAVGLMAVMAILLCLSGLIWYQYAVLRYGIIIAGCAVGAVLGYRVIKIEEGEAVMLYKIIGALVFPAFFCYRNNSLLKEDMKRYSAPFTGYEKLIF